jgi:hypothetical protein
VLSHADVRSELRELGVHADVADAIVAAGVLCRVGDELLVITSAVDEVTSTSQALVTFLVAEGEIRAGLVGDVVDLAVSRHPSASQVVLSIPATRAITKPLSARPYMRYVVATDELELPEPAPGWTIRRAVAQDAGDVVPLYVTAFVEGYAAAETSVPTAEAEVRGQSLFTHALADGAVFVAYGPQGFAGHATVIPDVDDLTGRSRLELFDLFVPAPFRSTPAGGLLTSAAVRHAQERGLVLRGYVSGHDANAEKVLDGLVSKGWRQDTTYLLIDLPAAVRPTG